MTTQRRFRITSLCSIDPGPDQLITGMQTGLLNLTDWSDDDIEKLATLKPGETVDFEYPVGMPWIRVARET